MQTKRLQLVMYIYFINLNEYVNRINNFFQSFYSVRFRVLPKTGFFFLMKLFVFTDGINRNGIPSGTANTVKPYGMAWNGNAPDVTREFLLNGTAVTVERQNGKDCNKDRNLDRNMNACSEHYVRTDKSNNDG